MKGGIPIEAYIDKSVLCNITAKIHNAQDMIIRLAKVAWRDKDKYCEKCGMILRPSYLHAKHGLARRATGWRQCICQKRERDRAWLLKRKEEIRI